MANITKELLADFAVKFANKVADIFAKKTDIPESLPADGGDAGTVNGHTVDADVPAGAKFTDTTYQGATASRDGLMIASDKEKLDGMTEATDTDIDDIIANIFKSGGVG